MTIITAKLSPWRLRFNGIEGTIEASINEDYVDGDNWVFINTSLDHYKYSEGHWPDHFIMKTQTGLYFMLLDSDRAGPEDAPMA